MSLLLKCGANVYARDKVRKQTALHYAALNGHVTVMEALIAAGADINDVDSSLFTVLHLAAMRNMHECMAFLVNEELIKAVNSHEETALHVAAYRGSVEAATVLLTHSKRGINGKNDIGDTPLHKAAANGQLAMVKALTSYPECRHTNNNLKRCRTAIEIAAHRGYPDVVEYLNEYFKTRKKSSVVAGEKKCGDCG